MKDDEKKIKDEGLKMKDKDKDKDKETLGQEEEDCCENCECCEGKCGENGEYEDKDEEKKKERIEELEGQLKKVLADYANMQRDNEKRQEMALIQLKARVAMDVITILDDVTLAEAAKKKIEMSEPAGEWADGIVGTLKKLNKSLEVLGITPMNCKVGEEFDSSKHEAFGVVYEGENGKINQVVQDGYVMKGTDIVVRAARVIVSKITN